MVRHRTFSQKVVVGFAVNVLLTVAIGAVAVAALHTVVSTKDKVIAQSDQLLAGTQRLRAAAAEKVSGFRTYLLTGQQRYLDEMAGARMEFQATLTEISSAAANREQRQLLDTVRTVENEHQQALDALIALRRSRASLTAVLNAFDAQAVPRRDALARDIIALDDLVRRGTAAEVRSSSVAAADASAAMVGIALGATVLAVVLGFVLTRALRRQIGTAVGRVQTSSTELEAAATQQASGAKQEATAMSEITTTINELLVTSLQISESAQRVAQIAGETATAARSGRGTVEQAHTSITAIRRQVDLVVEHMLELGQKSQQIGAIVEIVSELAEQTNILAINATIEAVGAGESGRRFAVVADEIRKLADRVTGSAKEIRDLIEDVRGAVNTTVMATETGSKAVDTGSRQFLDVATAFRQIAELVGTTTEAGREIELSTKQQSTAVEQVNVAVADVAQATRATEASSQQTKQTASELAALSTDLLRLVHAGAGG
ncbi:MAG: hypothetical protein V7603_2614 [Micromonosporaceae bacterium]